jgi:hypothetical protein
VQSGLSSSDQSSAFVSSSQFISEPVRRMLRAPCDSVNVTDRRGYHRQSLAKKIHLV